MSRIFWSLILNWFLLAHLCLVTLQRQINNNQKYKKKAIHSKAELSLVGRKLRIISNENLTAPRLGQGTLAKKNRREERIITEWMKKGSFKTGFITNSFSQHKRNPNANKNIKRVHQAKEEIKGNRYTYLETKMNSSMRHLLISQKLVGSPKTSMQKRSGKNTRQLYNDFMKRSIFQNPSSERKNLIKRATRQVIYADKYVPPMKRTCQEYIKLTYNDDYKVGRDFSIEYNGKVYKNKKYRVSNDYIEICDSYGYTQEACEIWKSWVFKQKCENLTLKELSLDHAAIGKRFAIYFAPFNRYFTRDEYVVVDTKPYVCKDKLEAKFPLNTSGELLLCKDSVFRMTYDREYQVFNNFSIFYNRREYTYNDYRVEEDEIKICNSSNIDVLNDWNTWNRWLKTSKKCDEGMVKLALKASAYTVTKDLTVYFKSRKEHFKQSNYVFTRSGKLAYICKETGNNLSLCSDSDVTIKYHERFEVWNNFSIFYKGEEYTPKKYRVTSANIKICNSSDVDIYKDAKEEMKKKCGDDEAESLDFFYTVDKNFTVYFAPSNQYFTRDEYVLDSPLLYVCKGKMRKVTTAKIQKDDETLCIGSKVNIAMNISNISEVITYNGKGYYPFEYKNLANDTIVQICNSSDTDTRNIWKYCNFWEKMQQEYERDCKKTRPLKFLDFRYKQLVNELKRFEESCPYMVKRWKGALCTCDSWPLIGYINPAIQLVVWIEPNVIIEYNDSYSHTKSNNTTLMDKKRSQIKNKNLVTIVFLEIFLSGLSLSAVCLVVLLIFYFIFPQLRTLPGKNLMSLSSAYLLWNVFGIICYSLYLTGYSRRDSHRCAPWVVTGHYFSFSIFTNITVNVYHLQKTFCTSIPSTQKGTNNTKQFVKYLAISWGIPFLVVAVEAVLIELDVVQFSFSKMNMCVYSDDSFWMGYVYLSLSSCLVIFDVFMFIVTGNYIRKKLTESTSILQNCNVMKKRKSFFILLKLSTIAGFNWLPVMSFSVSNPHRNIILALFVLTFLSGVCIAIAFVFTRKNFRLLQNRLMGRDKIQNKNRRAKAITNVPNSFV